MLVVVAGLMLPAPARCDETPPPAPPPSDDLSASHRDLDATTIQPAEPGREWWTDIIRRFPACVSLTDGCQSCAREADRLSCSTPAIACLRGEWRCTSPVDDQRPQQPRDPSSSQEGAQPDAKP